MRSRFSISRYLVLLVALFLILEVALITSVLPIGIRIYSDAVANAHFVSMPFAPDLKLKLPELQFLGSNLQSLAILLIVANAYLIFKYFFEMRIHKKLQRMRTQLPPRERLDAQMTISRAV